MSEESQPLFDPFASTEQQVEDAFEKGLISRENADRLIFAANFIDLNTDWLAEQFPGQAVSVVVDEAMPDEVALFPGGSVFEAESNARQFSQGRPYATFNPFDGLVHSMSEAFEAALLDELLEFLGEMAEEDEELKGLLQQAKKKDTEEEKKKKEKEREKLFDDIANIIPDDMFAKGFGPKVRSNDLTYTGGKIVSGKNKNFKNWLIDSGASTSAISKKNFDRLVKKGAKPKLDGTEKRKTATGVVNLPKYSGIKMQFVRTGNDGKNELVTCDVPLLIASNILGADQLKKTRTTFIFDPAAKKGELKAPPKPKKPAKKSK